MPTPIRLFDLPDLRADEPEPPPMSYGRRLTARNERLLVRGVHPATERPLLICSTPGSTLRCRDCRFATPTGRNVKTFWKCALNPRGFTRGARTDIRLRWPACERFERKPDVAVNEGTGVPSGDDRDATGDSTHGDDAVNEG